MTTKKKKAPEKTSVRPAGGHDSVFLEDILSKNPPTPTIYKIVLSSRDKIILIGESEVLMAIEKMAAGGKGSVVVLPRGVFNPSHYVGIFIDDEENKVRDEMGMEKYLNEKPSKFAHLLSKKFLVYTYESQRLALEEAAKAGKKS